MSDTTSLKLDRLLAGQERILARIQESDETYAAIAAGLSGLIDAVSTQTEVINQLAQALSEESPGGGDMQDFIKSIAISLKQIKEDGSRVFVQLGRLAPAVAQAAQDAVFMAMGDGVDIPPGEPS